MQQKLKFLLCLNLNCDYTGESTATAGGGKPKCPDILPQQRPYAGSDGLSGVRRHGEASPRERRQCRYPWR